jgi:uncharacterized protein
MNVEGIFFYPIKSLPGVSVQEWWTEPKGFRFDRRMMLIDSNNKFVSLRGVPELYHCSLEMSENNFLKITHPKHGGEGIFLNLENPEIINEVEVVIWNDTVKAGLMEAHLSDWFSEVFNKDLRLVFMGDSHQRQIDLRYANEGEMVSFADGYPYLIVQSSSLEYFNEKLETPVEMIRFRPNIVLKGGSSFEEDDWTQLRIGEVEFKLVKPCSRCKVINIDPNQLDLNPKVMETLKSFRPPTFGMNACLMGNDGKIRVGEEANVLHQRID